MALTDPIYKINNREVSASTIKSAAAQQGITSDEYISRFGGVLVPGKTTDSTITDPNVESGNTELDGENGSSGSVKLSDAYITLDDLRGNEEKVRGVLSRKMALVGLSAEESNSFEDLDAISLQKGPDTTVQDLGGGWNISGRIADAIGSTIFAPFADTTFAVGDDVPDDKLSENVIAINKYIEENGDSSFAKKANVRNGKLYKEDYIPYITAPDFTKDELSTQLTESKVELFNKIKDDSQVTATKGGKKFVVSETPVTIDNFRDEKEFEAYKAWELGNPMPESSDDDIALYDAKRKDDYAKSKSQEFASDLDVEQRFDILALAKNDINDVKNYSESKDKFNESVTVLDDTIKAYNLNPTIEGYTAASNLQIQVLDEQTRLQNIQNKAKTSGLIGRAEIAPLAIQDFDKNYSRLAQLGTAFKSTAGSLAYGASVLGYMATSNRFSGGVFGSSAVMNSQIEDATGLVSFGSDMRDESASFQDNLTVGEVNNMKDAGRWVAGTSMNLIPSLAMAATGPAALPMFFLSGFGGATQDLALEQKDAAERMTLNKKFLEDNQDLDQVTRNTLELEMDEDGKTLNISNWRNLTNATLHGIAEVALEKVGTMALFKSIKAGVKGIPISSIKEGFKFAGKEVGKGFYKEGGSEFATTLIQNFGDIYILDEDKNFFEAITDEGMFEGGAESFFGGALMGGGMTSINAVKGVKAGITSELATQEQKKNMQALIDKLQNLTGVEGIQNIEDLKRMNLDLDPNVQKMVDEITKEGFNIQEEILKGIQGNLNKDQLLEIGEINRKQRNLNKQLIGAVRNKNIKASALTAYEAELREQFDKLELQKSNILNNDSQIEKNKAKTTSNAAAWNSKQGYAEYSNVMLNESVQNIKNTYFEQSDVDIQKGYEAARAELKAEGAEFTEEDIKNKAGNDFVDAAYKLKIEKGEANAKKFAGDLNMDLNFQTFEGKDRAAGIVNAWENSGPHINENGEVMSEKEFKTAKAELIEAIEKGVFEAMEINGNIIIDKTASIKNKRVGVYSHEVLHAYARKTIGKDADINARGQELLNYLEKNQPDLYAKVMFRIKGYEGKSEYLEEAMNAMSDVLADGMQVTDGVKTQFRNFYNSIVGKLPGGSSWKLSEKENEGAYQFVKSFNSQSHFGKDSANESVNVDNTDTPSKSKASKTVLNEINDLVPPSVKTQADYFSPKVFNPIYKATQPNGVISNYIKSKSPSKEVGEKAIAGIQDRLVNYDPAAERKKAGNKEPITFGEFIFANTNFIKLDAKKALFKESEAAKKTTDLDTKEAQSKIAEDDVVKKDRPKFRKLIDSNVLPGFTIKEIGGKLTKVLKVLKSKLDTKVSINKSVSPLIAEIKKAMGKQADIDLKEAMGGKADAKLQKWLLKNKKAVLENMTTTWLMGAIPQAIQKSVGGTYKVDDAGTRIKDSYGDFIFVPNFTSDWQGKTIDREKTSTNKLGKTAGGDIVRRLPNIATALSDADFVGSVLQDVSIDADGKMTSGAPIRGKKESMAKAVAEEISLEVFNKELQNENSEISKAFENNQVAKGVVLVDSFTEDIARQSERGTVKFSLSNMSIVQNALFQDQNRKEQLKARIESAEGNIGENYKGLLGMLKEVYQGVDELESKLLPISKALYNVLKPYVKKDAKIALAKTGLTISELLENSFDSIDFSETIVQITGATSSVAAINSDLTSIAEAKEAVLKAFKNVEPSAVLSFISSTFANSGKVGRYKDGILGTSGASRADLWQNAEQAVNALKEFYPNTDWDAVNRDYSATAKVNKAHLGKLDVDKEIAKADAAWDFTVAIIKELKNIENPNIRALIMATMNSGTNTALRVAAPAIWRSSVLPSMNSKDYRYEHAVPARVVMALLYDRYVNNNTDIDVEALKKDYVVAIIPVKMDDVIGEVGFSKMMLAGYVPGKSPWYQRYYNVLTRGKVQYAIESQVDGEIIGESYVDYYNQANKTTLKASRFDGSIKVNIQQKAINNARSNKWSKSPKKIRVFDFDDTLARTKSNVLYTMPDGTTGKIDAATFAKDAGKMEAEGAQWDFSEFSKVMDGKAGPLLEVAKIIADKRGTKDVFVLTARPADAAGPIQEFLASMGLNIPIENITGLGNGTPKAKADWVVGKVADGYNDFYFADDHTGNVKAVKDALDTFDVKGKVQLAKVKFSKGLDTKFNDMIQRQKGVESFKEFSKATAQRRGKKVGKWKFFISPSAEDFRGLTQYKFAGKGKQGEVDQKFFEESLMDPYFQGVAALESARQAIKDDTKALLRMFKPVKKKLNKLIPNEQYTYDAAVRVYLWNKAGNEIPGLSKRDNKKLNDLVANDPELSAFADGLLLVSKKDSWPEPGEHWLAQTTLSDLNNLTEKTNRKEYLTEFIENVDIIFSEKNLNKVEALYGEASREAIENAISAMKSGSNSANQGGDAITSKWTQWVNNSIGTIMFFNRRSAILQTLSSANFINWSDNNPAKAALAFANQPQYWKDFAMIFNSDKLKQRRGGLKSDVQEAEIANAAKNTQDKAGAIVAYILKLGFTPTQIADSFAISLGGASLYRNRVKTYTKQGMDLKAAETKAFQDFTKLSDEAQQSGDPALVSQQQRSVAGRLILSFQNTTMQYTRLMKKSGQDIINGRGDAKTHVSKIIYYGAIQNFLFNALSQTAFALIPGFDEEEEDDDEKRDEALETKAAKILNGMSDSVVRGTGIYGAIITTLKNSFLTWERENKKGFTGDQTKTIIELANLSPAIGSKLRKVYSGIQTNQFDRDVIAKHPWSVTIDGKFNPSSTYTIIANLSSAAFNLPLDRALTEARGVAEMLDARNSVFQRIALGAGWRVWNVGAKNEEFDLIKAEGKIVRKKEGKEKAKKTRAKNKKKEEQRVSNLSSAERLNERKEKAREKKRKALAKKREKIQNKLTNKK